MTIPATELDPRFSAVEATPTDWATTRAALEAAQVSWIATVRADGRPHMTPLVSVWVEDVAYFATGPDEQKAVNLIHNQSVVLATGCNSWDRGLDVMVEGRATRVTDRSTLERLAAEWATRWEGQWQFEVVGDGFSHEAGVAQVYRVMPTKVLAFGKAPFSHTRHVFG